MASAPRTQTAGRGPQPGRVRPWVCLCVYTRGAECVCRRASVPHLLAVSCVSFVAPRGVTGACTPRSLDIVTLQPSRLRRCFVVRHPRGQHEAPPGARTELWGVGPCQQQVSGDPAGERRGWFSIADGSLAQPPSRLAVIKL